MAGGGARGKNLEHFQNLAVLRYNFLEVIFLTTAYQKAFILVPHLSCRVGALSSCVHARGGVRG